MANKRIKLSRSEEEQLFAETNGVCPLCGKSLIGKKGDGTEVIVYEAAHIYPHSPTSQQLIAFTAVPYIFEIVIFVLLFELALIVFLNYPFPVFPFR